MDDGAARALNNIHQTQQYHSNSHLSHKQLSKKKGFLKKIISIYTTSSQQARKKRSVR